MHAWLLAVVTTFTATNPQLSVQAIVEPDVAAPNSTLTVTFTVTPARRMHVYAPGSEYQPIMIKLDAQRGVTPRKLVYPPSDIYHFAPLDEHVPVYSAPFALKQVISIGPAAVKGKGSLTLTGTLEYQACDDRVCFKPNTIPFRFELPVKRAR